MLVHCTGAKSGRLHPSKEGLTNQQPVRDSISKEGMGHSNWSQWFQTMLTTACRCSSKLHAPWGAHTPKRAFHLLGVLGGARLDALMRNGRHLCPQTAKGWCFEDACVTRDFILSEPEVAAEQMICWAFRNKLMTNNGRTNSRIHACCSDRIEVTSMSVVAKRFMERQLGVGPNHRLHKKEDPDHLLRIGFAKSFTGTNPFTDFHDIADTLPLHLREPIKASFQAAMTHGSAQEAMRCRKSSSCWP
jgi:hypothetical protein